MFDFVVCLIRRARAAIIPYIELSTEPKISEVTILVNMLISQHTCLSNAVYIKLL